MGKPINTPPPLPTVSVINEKKRRISPTKDVKKDKMKVVHRNLSVDSIKYVTSHKPTVSVIEEVQSEEEQERDNESLPQSRSHSFKRNDSKQSSKISNTERRSQQSRTSSRASSLRAGSAGLAAGQTLQTGSTNSGLHTSDSSLRGSVRSLPVIREQYCCCQRWTFLERSLFKAVAVLALIIIGLIIAVGFLAKQKEKDHKFNNDQQKFLWVF